MVAIVKFDASLRAYAVYCSSEGLEEFLTPLYNADSEDHATQAIGRHMLQQALFALDEDDARLHLDMAPFSAEYERVIVDITRINTDNYEIKATTPDGDSSVTGHLEGLSDEALVAYNNLEVVLHFPVGESTEVIADQICFSLLQAHFNCPELTHQLLLQEWLDLKVPDYTHGRAKFSSSWRVEGPVQVVALTVSCDMDGYSHDEYTQTDSAAELVPEHLNDVVAELAKRFF